MLKAGERGGGGKRMGGGLGGAGDRRNSADVSVPTKFPIIPSIKARKP